MGEVIRRPITKQQERTRSRDQGVVGGGRPEFEEVEERQRGAEGEEAPDWVTMVCDLGA